MSNLRSVLVGKRDNDRLQALIKGSRAPEFEALFDELDAATVVPTAELPKDVVTMNSTITFVDADSGEESIVVLVFPNEIADAKNAVSILAPVGAALIGLREGESIDWPLPRGRTRKLKVISVTQP